MKVFRSLHPADTEFVPPEKSVVTIGGFDGIHLGHRLLISSAAADAKENDLPVVVITFNPIPAVYFSKSDEPLCLISEDEKISKIAANGCDYLFILPFDSQLAGCSAFDFLTDLKQTLNPVSLWIGDDFTFGQGGKGNKEYLASVSGQFGFDLHVVAKLEVDGGCVSSSRIRDLIRKGSIKQANELLGYHFGFSSMIAHGDGRGKTLGFPTLNMSLAPEMIVPAFGVYAAFVKMSGKVYQAVTNIGTRPTFKDDGKVVVESFLLDDSVNAYGNEAEIELIDFIRPERKFSDPEELKITVRENARRAAEILAVEEPF